MADKPDIPSSDPPHAAPGKVLSDAARRELAEAQARREAALAERREAEIGGRGGLDPVRYGDWEIRGLTDDF